jgi:DNA invertase Pin-like site-specific DNA recombinase
MIEARAKLISDAVWMGNFPEQKSAAKVRYYERPVFRDLLIKLQAGDILIVWRLDRLERSMFGMVEVLSELNKRDVRLIVLQHGGAELDLNSMTGKILALFLAGMAEMENNQRRESTRNAMQWRKEHGYACTRAPAGFENVPLPLKPGQNKPLKLIVPIDTAILDEIVQRVDRGEKLYSIARDFYDRELTYNGKPWVKRGPKHYSLELNNIRRAYYLWRDHPLRVKPATPGDASSPSASSDASASDPSPKQDPSSPDSPPRPCPPASPPAS